MIIGIRFVQPVLNRFSILFGRRIMHLSVFIDCIFMTSKFKSVSDLKYETSFKRTFVYILTLGCIPSPAPAMVGAISGLRFLKHHL